MDAGKQRAILFDMTRCSGCKKCVAACMQKQGFPGDPDKVEDLSATAYTAVFQKDFDGDEYNYRNLCRHCVVPTCASVCPVGALQKTELGPVVYDADKCMGCRYCMTACPFNVPRYEWDSPVPAVRKCNMCVDRLEEGKLPMCAEVCPNEATVAGTREELLKEAHARIEEDPDEYHPHVYGEDEIGGTNVLFLSPKPIEELGFKASLGTDPLPVHTWRILEKIPGIALTAGATMVALWWLTERRNDVMALEGREAQAKGGPKNRSNGQAGSSRN